MKHKPAFPNLEKRIFVFARELHCRWISVKLENSGLPRGAAPTQKGILKRNSAAESAATTERVHKNSRSMIGATGNVS